ncbi:GTP 3',8-cyclase MoaA [Selenihalanaerobacter shriftii]|uniref:GTP 3',8-cyclase n=1 Tax=Selenihalanaerobacter shriftii TaxID=142842 RepID=A0A1T4JVP6_9FIRM|nr:GTP 3',8-cyclase MoaA [Selenihalanaerobacter shriftii]SJZ34137.1 cyclic pyranopterin monophosphate synthase subunit MoaA [Selenihalanaerobacter shriftii]
MQDKYKRKINYLRVSVTDRCNLRCFYCMPEGGIDLKNHKEILRYEELYKIIKSANELGVKKVRLTGGEPLVRKGLVNFIREIKGLGIEDLSLTTNGVLLAKYAEDLVKAGLDRVNISLDTLKDEKFNEISRSSSELSQVLLGIEEAQRVGLTPLKLNVVPIKGINDNEIEDFAKLTLDNQLIVRFIELMPLGESYNWAEEKYISISDIKERLIKLDNLISTSEIKGNGPAKYYQFPNAKGKIGFISPISDHYCSECNRIRLTADGFLKPCLHSDNELNIKKELRNGVTQKELKDIIRDAIFAKPEKGLGINADDDFDLNQRQMSQIGG